VSIIDNRIQLTDAEAIAPAGFPGEWVDAAAGTMSLTLDTATFVEGVAAVADRASSSRIGILWQEDADRDWSDNVFYIWFNCVVANKLGTKAAGGLTIRFTGPTVTNWFEVYIDGSDTYGGGYKMAVVDIEEARAAALRGGAEGATNGTPPQTSAIRRVGVIFDVLSSAPGSADNCFVDAIWRLPNTEPGVIVAGENTSGSPNPKPYNWTDVLEAGDNSDPTKAWGVISKENGVFFLNTPVQFGNNGSPNSGDHDFEDTNVVIAWESQLVNDEFYGFTIVGDGVNTQRFVAGVKSGTGDEAIGSQGWVVLAAADGPRWSITANDADIEDAQFQGCTFIHTNVLRLNSANVEMRSTQLIDGVKLRHSSIGSPSDASVFTRNSIISPATNLTMPVSPLDTSLTDVAYIDTSDPEKIRYCSFIASAYGGHAIRILNGGTYAFVGNDFSGYGADDTVDAAISFEGAQERLWGWNEKTLQPSDAPSVLKTPLNFGGAIPFEAPSLAFPFLAHVNLAIEADLTSPASLFTASPQWRIVAELWASTASDSAGAIPEYKIAESYPIPAEDIGVRYLASSSPNTEFITEDGWTRFVFPSLSPDEAVPPSPNLYWLHVRYEPEIGSNARIMWNQGGGSPLQTLARPRALLSIATSPQPFGGPTSYDIGLEIFAFRDPDLVLNVSEASSPTTHEEYPDITSLTINNNVLVTLTNIRPGTEIRVYNTGSPLDITEIAGIESTGSPGEFQFSAPAASVVDIVVLNLDYVLPPANRIKGFIVPSTATSFPITQVIDRNYNG
jgi:hypothetical protein